MAQVTALSILGIPGPVKAFVAKDTAVFMAAGGGDAFVPANLATDAFIPANLATDAFVPANLDQTAFDPIS